MLQDLFRANQSCRRHILGCEINRVLALRALIARFALRRQDLKDTFVRSRECPFRTKRCSTSAFKANSRLANERLAPTLRARKSS
jgi:hypothetical protein